MSKFKKVNVAGDGACYFHAVVGFQDMERLVKDKKTYYKKGLDKEASDLRKKVVTWLRNNLTFQYENGLTIQDDIEDEIRNNPKIQSVNDYLRDMSRPSAYAGQIEITATANILKRNIRVFVKKQGRYRNVGLGYEINRSKDKDITLFHNMGTSKGSGKHHFEILFPTSKAQVVTKSNYDTLKSKVKYKMKRTRRANKHRDMRRPTRYKTTRRKISGKHTLRMGKRKSIKRSSINKRKSSRKRRSNMLYRGGLTRTGGPRHDGPYKYTINDAPFKCDTPGCDCDGFLDRYTTMVTSRSIFGSTIKSRVAPVLGVVLGNGIAQPFSKQFKLLECVKCSRIFTFTNHEAKADGQGYTEKVIKAGRYTEPGETVLSRTPYEPASPQDEQRHSEIVTKKESHTSPTIQLP